ncbi:hypothetical protein E3W82_00645 [Listeria monocytogenes]|uniref:Uncharacterized protein n=1 Tax=Listeria cossartiae subsp. cayugensis TaxID=2713505 RepID=A0ABU2IIW6_9LIST|nr:MULTISPECIES: hypothetical protein [Listeria]EAF4456250.1 hypothetical protein [Listeria monocytogenes serotype 1/2a]EAC5221451.1 hypothetical protein [Listeria monocytogenes]EAE3677839.1 hypothetical protein [Listeria monocytogenes]EAE5902822.1 hypothetical protein [Listeria monocytogenes]EAE6661981.1 hypothetical protein [Listeria monocytogenes]
MLLEEIKVNDIFCTSWGYEQTNVSFWQVVKRTPKSVTLRPIKKRIVEIHSNMSRSEMPILNEFTSSAFSNKEDYSITKMIKGGATKDALPGYHGWDDFVRYEEGEALESSSWY